MQPEKAGWPPQVTQNNLSTGPQNTWCFMFAIYPMFMIQMKNIVWFSHAQWHWQGLVAPYFLAFRIFSNQDYSMELNEMNEPIKITYCRLRFPLISSFPDFFRRKDCRQDQHKTLLPIWKNQFSYVSTRRCHQKPDLRVFVFPIKCAFSLATFAWNWGSIFGTVMLASGTYRRFIESWQHVAPLTSLRLKSKRTPPYGERFYSFVQPG